MDEIDPLLNVALQASLASLEKFLLIVVDLGKDVVGFLCSGGLMFGQQSAAEVENKWSIFLHIPQSQRVLRNNLHQSPWRWHHRR